MPLYLAKCIVPHTMPASNKRLTVMKPLQATQTQGPRSDSDCAADHVHDQSIVIPTGLNTIADIEDKKEHSW